MATFFLRYMNPIWWAYAVTLKLPLSLIWFVLSLPWKTVTGIVKAYKWTMTKFTSWYSRLIVLALAVWTAIPGTWAWTFYELAHMTGYGEEADMAWNTIKFVATSMWSAGKFAVGYALA